MRDILLAIISLLLTLFIQSCTSGNETKTAVSETAKEMEKQPAKEIVKEVSVTEAIPALYKGMAESPENKLGGLKVGDAAPNITARTSDGKEFDLHSELKAGPIGIVFYRGFWCPKCTRHLEELQIEILELKERGLRLYAVTPETDEYIDKTIEKSSVSIPFIHDKAHKIMDDYKVTYKVTDDYKNKVGGFAGVGLAESHDAEDAYLPVPATYLINEEGKIFYAHYDHNYGNRATATDMLAALASR